MKKKSIQRMLTILFAVLMVISVSSVSAFARQRAYVSTSAVNYTRNGQENVVVYDFPFASDSASRPTVEGKTLEVYSYDGVYLGETTPLKKIGTAVSTHDGKKYNIYRCTLNGQPIYFQDWSFQPIFPEEESAKAYGVTLEPNAFQF